MSRLVLGLLVATAAAAAEEGCSAAAPAGHEVQGVVMLQTTSDLGRRHHMSKKRDLKDLLEQAPGYAVATEGAALSQTGASTQSAAVACDERGHPMVVGSCFTTYYALALVMLVLLAVILIAYVMAQRHSVLKTEAKLRSYRSKLRNDKRTSDEHDKLNKDCLDLIKDAKADVWNSIADPAFTKGDQGTMLALNPKSNIDFQEPDYGSYPYARLAQKPDSLQALDVLAEIKDLLRILPSLRVLIESHTPSAESSAFKVESLEFAHELAFNRAELVKAELVAMGVGEERLGAIGLPGKFGDNEPKIVFRVIDVN